MKSLLLASRSPRRAQLLEQIGVTFEVVDVNIDETQLASERPKDYVERLALEKALSGAEQKYLALGADTIVVCDGVIMGKPIDQQHGQAMLQRLSGRTHQVMTAVCIVEKTRPHSILSVTDVTFDVIEPELISAYWGTGEPVDKAGGYGIQGFGAIFVKSIEGSYSGVVGLPLFETTQLLKEVGISPWQLKGSV